MSAFVTGPTGEPVQAALALRDGTAVVELAEASGIRRLPGGRRDPLGATSRGTGELLAAALDRGCDSIVLGVGGSASTDGGAGLLQALGARLLDEDDEPIGSGGGSLGSLKTVDLTGLDPRLREVQLVLASDVDNPLLGPQGAAAVYAGQKGASPGQIRELERGLAHWAELIARAVDADRSGDPGAGAAGGVGFAAMAVLGAQMRPGVDLVLELIDFAALLPGARLVITGEGALDGQSLRGKAPIGVASAATRAGVPTVAVVGTSALSDAAAAAAGLRGVFSLASIEPDPAVSIRDAGPLVERVVNEQVAPQWLAS